MQEKFRERTKPHKPFDFLKVKVTGAGKMAQLFQFACCANWRTRLLVPSTRVNKQTNKQSQAQWCVLLQGGGDSVPVEHRGRAAQLNQWAPGSFTDPVFFFFKWLRKIRHWPHTPCMHTCTHTRAHTDNVINMCIRTQYILFCFHSLPLFLTHWASDPLDRSVITKEKNNHQRH